MTDSISILHAVLRGLERLPTAPPRQRSRRVRRYAENPARVSPSRSAPSALLATFHVPSAFTL